MEDLNNSNSNRNSELIRQGIIQCLTLETECTALKENLAESRDYSQRLEAENEELRFRILEMREDQAEMRAEQEGLMKLLGEKDSLIESYSVLVSTTLDRTVHRERQDLREIEDKVLSTLEQDLNIEMSKMAIENPGSSDSERSQLPAKRPGLVRQGALRRRQTGRETVPRFVRQDAQMHKHEEGGTSPEGDSLLEMAREVTVQKLRMADQ
ncbi:uncharacterized protein FMAN_11978 [Fusarium mangiferae]|uniref:Uncharacterized protein n=1 Tax=Fusarium mangiferae TaxID=192010 RepID=A0A1L7U840_FUSMA|nr:uncharacterized protein FMAN_11978 [Fusarium mangiferae]CVL06884.1 uncharacterized protein FMAN_11978 [Fusarium mangiferae]